TVGLPSLAAISSSSSSESRSEEHTSELQSHLNLVCRLLLEKNSIRNQQRIEIPLCRRSVLCEKLYSDAASLGSRSVRPFFFLIPGAPRIPPLFPHRALSG